MGTRSCLAGVTVVVMGAMGWLPVYRPIDR